MNKHMPSRKSMAKQSTRLGAYLAAGLGASTVATPSSDAALVVINIGPTGFNIGAINGGVTYGGSMLVKNFPSTGGGTLKFDFNYSTIGLTSQNSFAFAVGPSAYTNPLKLSLNATIGSGLSFVSTTGRTAFRTRDYYYGGSTIIHTSPNFGAGSYMGFRTKQGNYGWLEVTWTSASNQFQILSGAYESVPNVAILAGATAPAPAPVPEPGTWAAAALLAGGAAFARWRKRRDEAQKEAA